MLRYNNYHKHDYYSNVVQLDVTTSLEDYCKRAVELGHDTLFTTNHGTQANIFEAKALGEKYNLKVILGVESYYVENRFDKDKTNSHIILIALNDDGAKDINRIISYAHEDGFYYKPRIDWQLIDSVNPKNIVITTACIAGIWNNENLILRLHEKFKENFFLEVQNHNVEGQKIVNKTVLDLSKKYGIKIIHANDSHYIKESDKDNIKKVKIGQNQYDVLPADRNLFLKAKGILYEEENNFILDYPDSETIIDRYKKQGILTDKQIEEAINNTLIFDNASPLTIINDDIKLPSVSENPIEDLRKLIREKWKDARKNIDKSLWDKYQNEIAYELDIVEKTNMANYFLIDYNIVKIAQEKYGGVLTRTGRGSAPSFYIINLLGLTNIDRIDAPVTLFPTRFMSVERIIGTRSLPDKFCRLI
jgi:DNA polymerase III alpha subunit